MRDFLFFIVIALTLTACNSNSGEKQTNESLAKSDRTVIYEVLLDIDPEFTNWMGNIDRKKMLQNIFDQVENGDLDAYEPFSDLKESKMSWSDVEFKFGGSDTMNVLDPKTGEYIQRIIHSQVNLSEILGIIFIEEWNLDSNNNLVKEVLGMAPVRYHTTVLDDGEVIEKKRIIFVTYFGEKKPALFEGF